jgi:hypothetical protein
MGEGEGSCVKSHMKDGDIAVSELLESSGRGAACRSLCGLLIQQ